MLSPTENHTKTGTRVRAVTRATRLLMHVAESGVTTVSAAAASTGLAVPTAHHLLSTLAAEGLVSRAPDRRYALGPAVGVLAERYEHASMPLPWLSEPLRQLVEETGETGYVSAWRNDTIGVLASIEGEAAVHVTGVQVGPYHSAHARASGKLLLAYATEELRQRVLGSEPLPSLTSMTITDRSSLAEEFELIRNRGWSEDVEEFADGLCCVSAPAMLGNTVLAAFSLSVPAHNFDHRRKRLVAAVQATARTAVLTHSNTPEKT